MKKIFLILLTCVSLAACKQDFTNPGAISSDDAFATPRTLAGVAVGLQNAYTNGRLSNVYTGITAAGALTNEFRLMNAGNTDEANLFIGGVAVDNLNGIVGNMWTWNNKVIFDADNVLTGAKKLGDPKYATGLIAYASIYKALAIGNLCMFFEQIPAAPGTGSTAATFQTRIDGYKRAVATLQVAKTALADPNNTPGSDFYANVPSSVNAAFFNNTINALIARYSLFAGDYATAITSSLLVPSTYGGSVMAFDAVTTNPIFTNVTTTNNVYQILDSTLGLPTTLAPDLTDQRIPFYTIINTTVTPRYRIKGFFSTTTQSIPIYVPGEMNLIRAECYVKQATPNLASAVTEINIVRQKTSDPLGVFANTTAYAGTVDATSLTNEIYRQRCIELCMSGMRLEDSRRLGRPAAERKRNFFPYPSRERDNNPNTPADPSN